MSPVVAGGLIQAEHGVLHHQAAAVPGDAGLQLLVGHLKCIEYCQALVQVQGQVQKVKGQRPGPGLYIKFGLPPTTTTTTSKLFLARQCLQTITV